MTQITLTIQQATYHEGSQPMRNPALALALPSIKTILASPGVSYELKRSLTAALRRDPLDALKDAQLLAALLERQAREVFTLGENI